MKIIHAAPRFFPYIGGVENYIYSLSKELLSLGHSVSVVCANEPRRKREESIEGIRVKRLAYVCKIANTNITLGLLAALLKEDFDIIHAHLPDPWSAVMAVLAGKIKKKPLVLTYSNDIVGKGVCRYIAKLFNLILLPFVLRYARKIIIYHAQYSEYSPYLEPYSQKICAVPLGVVVSDFEVPSLKNSKEKAILFLGLLDKFHRYKGLKYLIKSMSIVMRKVSNAKLYVGGEGTLKDEYRQLARSLGLEDRVEFTGFIPNEELASFYSRADVFVLPSVSRAQEGFGIVLLEAMAAGIPVVTTDVVGTARDIQENSSGRVVPVADEVALADAIIDILQDEKKAQIMGQNGRRLAIDNYDWRKIAEKISRIYMTAATC